MDKNELIGMLNQGIELEYQAFIQYYYQSLKLTGLNTVPLKEFLAKEADAELGHAKTLAERVVALGGEPSQRIAPVELGETVEEMIRNNLAREEKAIALYRNILDYTRTEKGYELVYYTVLQILGDELEDIEEFEAFLG